MGERGQAGEDQRKSCANQTMFENNIEAIYGAETNEKEDALREAVAQLEDDLEIGGETPIGYEVWRADYYDLEREGASGVGLNVELTGSKLPEEPENAEVVSEIPAPTPAN